MSDPLDQSPSPPAERQCYYLSNQVIHGPVPASQLYELASQQRIGPDDLIWFDHHEGLGIPLRELNLTTRVLLGKSRTNKARTAAASLPVADLAEPARPFLAAPLLPTIPLDAAGYIYRDPQDLKLTAAIFVTVPVLLGCVLNFAQTGFAASSQTMFLLGLMALFGVLMSMVIYFCWLYRVCANVHAMGAADLQFAPAGAVLWHFAPLLNLVMPYLALQEIWRASAAPRNWKEQPGHSLISLYWATNVISILCFGAALLMRFDAVMSRNWSQFHASTPFLVFGSIASIIGVLLLVAVICAISNRQSATVRAARGIRSIPPRAERPNPFD